MNDELKQSEMIEKEKYLRLAADFENYRRRMEGSDSGSGGALAQAMDVGKGFVIGQILDALDIFDQAKTYEGETDGLKLVHSKLLEVLKKHNVERIKTVKEVFDPKSMEAVQMKPPNSQEQSGLVAEEVRAGYTMHERVIRPARVIIYQ